ncbi:insulinase family protein [Thiolapillus sp.]
MKKTIAVLTLALFLGGCAHQWLGQNAAGDGAEVIKSANDKRQYEYLVLPNRMRVLLVSDAQADKAAAAMTIAVGSTSNPPGREGLAHFLEHMLFMGTEKYPDVDEYSSFIKRNGGSDNAFTASNMTTYYFDIKAEQLEPALDRFAQFFIAPLFDAKYVEREANAVHSEYQLKLKEDARRINAAEKRSYNPASPHARFFVGNLDSLSDRPHSKIRHDLIDFYNKYYSANIMGLTVVGKESLPELRTWVEEKFAAVPDNDARPDNPEAGELLYLPSQLPVKVAVVPLKKLHRLTLNFPIPSQRANYQAKPVSYLAHFIGDEGRGSLHGLLREKGWITSLSAGGQNLDDVQGVFSVNMELTESGVRHVPEIVRYLFQYIDLLRSEGIERWRFEELRRKSELDFRFEEKMPAASYATVLSAKLLHYPPRDLLRAGKVAQTWNPQLLKQLLGYLRPENMAMTLVDPALKTDAVEPYYQVAYSAGKMPQAWLAQWRPESATPKLALPQPNPFLPEKVELKTLAQNSEVPVALEQESGRSLWYQQDVQFGVPKAVFMLALEMPDARGTAKKAVSLSLLVDLVKDQLNAWSYPAQLAGLGYSITPTMEGLTLFIYGYDEKQSVLLEKVLAALKNPDLPEDRFKLYKDKLKRSLANQALERPYIQLLGERSRRLLSPSWSPAQKLQALEHLGREEVRVYASRLFDQVEARVLAYGNITIKEAEAMHAVLNKELLSASRLTDVPEPSLKIIPKGATERYRYEMDHPDSAVVINYQGNGKRIAEQARWRLLGHILASPFFNSLRTEQQLGYVVAAGFSEMENLPGMLFLAQSSVVSADELQKRMETFVKEYARVLQDMDEEEFRSHQAGLLAELLKKDDMMLVRAARYLDNLEREQYSFDFKKRVAEAVRGVDKAELLAFYRQNLLQEPRRLVVYSSGTRNNPRK